MPMFLNSLPHLTTFPSFVDRLDLEKLILFLKKCRRSGKKMTTKISQKRKSFFAMLK